MSRFSRQSQVLAWTMVGAVIVGALLVAVGLIGGTPPVMIVGVAVVVVTLAVYFVLSRKNAVAPVSFEQEFPADTPRPRATRDGQSAPPIDTNSPTKR